MCDSYGMVDEPTADGAALKRAPARRVPAAALVLVASLLAFLAIPSIWVNRQFLNTDNWAATSSEMLENPIIRNQVATYLVDELYTGVDVEASIREALPARARPLAGPIANALRDQVEKRARVVLARPRFQQRWENANRAAHTALLRILEGGGPIASTEGGVVTLDLKALLAQLQQQVGVGGRAAAALPAGAAQITIMRSDQLKTAQNGLKVLKALPVVFVVLSFVLFAIALVIAPGWRRQAVRAYGWGFIIAGVGALAAASIAGGGVVDSLSSTAAVEPTVAAAWDIGTSRLDEVATATIGYGVVMVFGAWLAGSTRWAIGTRRTLAPTLREPALAWGAFAVVMAIVVLWWQPTPATRDPLLAVIFIVLAGARLGGAAPAYRPRVPDGHPRRPHACDAGAGRRGAGLGAPDHGGRRRGRGPAGRGVRLGGHGGGAPADGPGGGARRAGDRTAGAGGQAPAARAARRPARRRRARRRGAQRGEGADPRADVGRREDVAGARRASGVPTARPVSRGSWLSGRRIPVR